MGGDWRSEMQLALRASGVALRATVRALRATAVALFGALRQCCGALPRAPNSQMPSVPCYATLSWRPVCAKTELARCAKVARALHYAHAPCAVRRMALCSLRQGAFAPRCLCAKVAPRAKLRLALRAKVALCATALALRAKLRLALRAKVALCATASALRATALALRATALALRAKLRLALRASLPPWVFKLRD